MLIRYYIDEHIFADAATARRHRNIDVLTTAEAHLPLLHERQKSLQFCDSVIQ